MRKMNTVRRNSPTAPLRILRAVRSCKFSEFFVPFEHTPCHDILSKVGKSQVIIIIIIAVVIVDVVVGVVVLVVVTFGRVVFSVS